MWRDGKGMWSTYARGASPETSERGSTSLVERCAVGGGCGFEVNRKEGEEDGCDVNFGGLTLSPPCGSLGIGTVRIMASEAIRGLSSTTDLT